MGSRTHCRSVHPLQGVVHDNVGQCTRAIECYKRFLRYPECAATPEFVALGHNAIALSYEEANDLPRALKHHALHGQAASTPLSQVIALCNAGLVYRRMGDLPDADRCHRGALEISLRADLACGQMLACGHIGLNCWHVGGRTHETSHEELVRCCRRSSSRSI